MKKMLLSVAMISLISFGANAQNDAKKDKKNKPAATEQQAADPAAQQQQPAVKEEAKEMSTPVQQAPAVPDAQAAPVQADPAKAPAPDTATPGK